MSSPVEMENRRLTPEMADNDAHLEVELLKNKVQELEKQKVDIQDNYNAQRGRLQKLYMQKEEELSNISLEVQRLTKELNDAKSELCVAGILKENEVAEEKRKAEAEIATLNRIVQDTVEVSSTSHSEVKKLKQIIVALESQVTKLRGDKDKEREKDGSLLAPANMLLATKTLARKVVGQLGNDTELRPQDNLEDSMKKAQEDADVLRSLVIPLEKKIQELSDRLAMTQQRLRKYEPQDVETVEDHEERRKLDRSLIDFNSSQESGEGHSPKGLEPDAGDTELAVSPSRSAPCNMCLNYETQLVTQQQDTKALAKEKEALEQSLERFREDLLKEKHIRKDIENEWTEKKEEHKVQVADLKTKYETAEARLKKLQEQFGQFCNTVRGQLQQLTYDREEMDKQLQEIQMENDKLVGRHSKNAERLREEVINFPDNVEELQEQLLKLTEELITSQVAKETNEERVETLRCELDLLRDQLRTEVQNWQEKEATMVAQSAVLRKELEAKERERQIKQHTIENLMAADGQHKDRLRELEDSCRRLQEEKKMTSELRNRMGALQQELDTSTTVQKDFVRLSQSLQMELEKIRGADAEVRWQHDEDVDECPACRMGFTGPRKKVHCRHCGHIFCSSCLNHQVLSGPKKRPSRVCQVCHTLLNKDSAPYFSQEAPHSPD